MQAFLQVLEMRWKNYLCSYVKWLLELYGESENVNGSTVFLNFFNIIFNKSRFICSGIDLCVQWEMTTFDVTLAAHEHVLLWSEQ